MSGLRVNNSAATAGAILLAPVGGIYKENSSSTKEGQRDSEAHEISPQAKKLQYIVRRGDLHALEAALPPAEVAAPFIHEIDDRLSPPGRTALSVAIQFGQEDIIRTLLHCCPPLRVDEGILVDAVILRPKSWWGAVNPNFEEWWSLNEARDPSAIALRSLFETNGDGESIFHMILEAGLRLEDAARCDIGRSLWFWAIRKGYVSIVKQFLAAQFPVNLRSSRTSYHSRSEPDEEQILRRSRRGRYEEPKPYEELAPLGTDGVCNACYKGNMEMLRLLLDHGATLEVKHHETGMERLSGPVEDSHAADPLAGVYLGCVEKCQPLRVLKEDGLEQAIDAARRRRSLFNREKRILRDDLDMHNWHHWDTLTEEENIKRHTAHLRRCGNNDLWNDLCDPELVPVLDAYRTVFEFLLEKGPNVNRRTSLRPVPDINEPNLKYPLVPIVIGFAHHDLWSLVEILIRYGATITSTDANGKSLAHFAARTPDLRPLQDLLDRECGVDTPDKHGYTPLHEAVFARNYEAVRLLLGRKAEVNGKAKNGTSPLLLAIEAQDFCMVQDLISAGADVNQEANYPKDLFQRLFQNGLAGGIPQRSRLIASTPLLAGIATGPSNEDDDDGQWPQQCEDVQLTILQLLLDKGADPFKRGYGDRSELPYQRADRRNHSAELGAVYPISVAAAFHQFRPLQMLLDAAGNTATEMIFDDAMHAACVLRIYEFEERLGIRPSDWMTEYYSSNSSDSSDSPLPSRFHVPATEMMLLLDQGADPNLKTSQGLRPLHAACIDSDAPTALIVKLLQHGAGVNIEDLYGRTPFHYAAVFRPRDLPVLLEAGADVDIYDNSGHSAMYYACAGLTASSPKAWTNSDLIILMMSRSFGWRANSKPMAVFHSSSG